MSKREGVWKVAEPQEAGIDVAGACSQDRLGGIEAISVAELRFLVECGRVPVVRLHGEPLVAVKDVEAYLARHGSEGPADV